MKSAPRAQHDWTPIRAELERQGVDAWVVFDYRGSSTVLPRIIGKAHLTRRVFWVLGRGGEPVVVCHRIDDEAFKQRGIEHRTYAGWADMPAVLAGVLGPAQRVAMEYSAGGSIPTASTVDGGTLDLVRALGAEVVGSADLVALFAAVWSARGLEAHRRASALTEQIMKSAFAFIGARIREGGSCQERLAQLHITGEFARHGLSWPDDPIVAVNAHSASPHYAPDDSRSAPITRGDWVLIDLWARDEGGGGGGGTGDEAIYSDITWTGCAGAPSARQLEVFHAVRRARDASLHLAQARWQAGALVAGYELDDAAAGVLKGAQLGAFVKHRTGHSLSGGALVHGIGMNLDNLETHDTRRVLAGTGFTIEPGAYLDTFGVRNEINVYIDMQRGPVVTSCVQDEPVRIEV
jgi:Xaa-Pro dipeptidase